MYFVQRLFNKIVVDRWTFSALEAAKACFDENVSELPAFMEEKIKFRNSNCTTTVAILFTSLTTINVKHSILFI